jgi:hypothetical protein
MAYYYSPNQFRISSSAFLWGRLVRTDYNTGCLRRILLQSLDISTTIDPKYEIIGKMNEDRHAKMLDEKGTVYVREMVLQRPSKRVPGVEISGHADFVITDALGRPTAVHELKSITSKNVRREVIGKGFFKTENLAQVVAYMGELDLTDGALIYTYYEHPKTASEEDKKDWLKLEAVDARTFSVHVDTYGRIHVDAHPTEFTAYDVIAHRNAAVEVIAKQNVVDRPYRHDTPFVSPCHWCAFKATCDAYDNGEVESDVAFVDKARNQISGGAK